VPGANFDWDRKCWLFPISEHDRLQVALSYHGLSVIALPRQALASITLANSRNNAVFREYADKSSIASNDNRDSNVEDKDGGLGMDKNKDMDKDECEYLPLFHVDFFLLLSIQKPTLCNISDILRELNAINRIPKRLLRSLAPFQRAGVHFVLQNNGRAILGDEMGLGKTVQAIAASTCYREVDYKCAYVYICIYIP
jgi:SNF2 family DNA or RNA helicase